LAGFGVGKVNWTRLPCHRFRANEVWLLLGVITHKLGNRRRRGVASSCPSLRLNVT